MQVTDEQIAAFWSKVDRRGDGCWHFIGKSRSQDGYGMAHICGRHTTAHRIAYFMTCGTMPPSDMHVMHSCDNRLCCNPAHLTVGTPKDNARDRVAKGRSARWKGKLTDEDRVAIRSMMARGIRAQDIANQFGVRRCTVKKLVRGG